MKHLPTALRSRRLTRSLIAVAVVAVLVSAGSASAAMNWHATVGVDSADHAIQANAFLPREMWIDVNDTVTWTLTAQRSTR